MYHLHRNILRDGDLVYIEVQILKHTILQSNSLFYVFDRITKICLNKNNFEVISIENKFYGPKDASTPRRHFQYNIHCLAKKVSKINFETTPMQGENL